MHTVRAISPTFGGVNLEDISAPRCFEIEERLKTQDYIIPSVFNREVVAAVAGAVAQEARDTGLAAAGAEIGFANTEEFGVIPGR